MKIRQFTLDQFTLDLFRAELDYIEIADLMTSVEKPLTEADIERMVHEARNNEQRNKAAQRVIQQRQAYNRRMRENLRAIRERASS